MLIAQQVLDVETHGHGVATRGTRKSLLNPFSWGDN